MGDIDMAIDMINLEQDEFNMELAKKDKEIESLRNQLAVKEAENDKLTIDTSKMCLQIALLKTDLTSAQEEGAKCLLKFLQSETDSGVSVNIFSTNLISEWTDWQASKGKDNG